MPLFHLREPEEGIPLTPDTQRKQECKEHFAPMIEQVREFCRQQNINVLHARTHCGEVRVQGAPGDLKQLNAFLQENKLIDASEPLIFCTGDKADCIGAHAVIATQWEGGVAQLCNGNGKRMHEQIRNCLEQCSGCKQLLAQTKQEYEKDPIPLGKRNTMFDDLLNGEQNGSPAKPCPPPPSSA